MSEIERREQICCKHQSLVFLAQVQACGVRTRGLLSIDSSNNSLVGGSDNQRDNARSFLSFGPSRFAYRGRSNEVILVVNIDVRLIKLGFDVVLVVQSHRVLNRR